MTAEDITARVQRGADLLDEKRPGWWQEINLGRLDIGSSCNCVGGQLSGGLCSFIATMESLDLDANAEDEFVRYGFEADGNDHATIEADYAGLTAAWHDLITARREMAGVPA